MMTDSAIDYRLMTKAAGWRSGAHGGRGVGGLGTFRDTVSFLTHPDPRRIDHRASLRDPFEMVHVRRFELRTAITLYLILDLSASMAHTGQHRRMDLIAALYRGLAATARRCGDALGVIGCGEALDERVHIPASRSGARDEEIAQTIAAYEPQACHSAALEQVGDHISGKNRLVFLVSDFHLPLPLLESCLQGLARHDIVPLRLTTPAENGNLPNRGLTQFIDRESGRRRIALLRPSLLKTWRDQAAAHDRAVARLLETYGRPAVPLWDDIDPASLNLILTNRML